MVGDDERSVMTGSPDQGELELLLAKARIDELLVSYATALDNRDWALLEQCFVEDAQVTYLGRSPLEGRQAVIDYCRTALSRFELTQHLVGNHAVELGDQSAEATSYVRAEHILHRDGERCRWSLGGRYEDRLVRTGQGWRIAERALIHLWDETTCTPIDPA